MAKKSFGNGFDSLLSSSLTDDVPMDNEPNVAKEATNPPSSKKNKDSGFTNKNPVEKVSDSSEDLARGVKTSMLIKEPVYEQIQALAYWERKLIKDVLFEALDDYIRRKGSKTVKEALEAFRGR